MCFSASASFSAGVVLGTIGAIAITKIQKPSQAPFASIPILFAIHQVSEGFVWMGLPEDKPWVDVPVYFYLVFAQVIWPAWVPFTFYKLEEDQSRKKMLRIFLGIGIAVALYLSYCLIAYDIEAEIHEGHIQYTLDFPETMVWLSGVLYFIPIMFSPFVSSISKMAYLGGGLFITFILAQIFFEDQFISVWCFFAAILSVVVLQLMLRINKKKLLPLNT